MSPGPNHSSRLTALDAVRLAAALAVVAYHFTARSSAAWDTAPRSYFPNLSGIAAYGSMGVHLFFIVSGFVILMSVQGRTVAQFAASRVARIFPAYWVSVLLTATLLIIVAGGSLKRVTWSQALVNLTMLQEALGVGHVDGVYWTLWVELLFYLTIGILLAAGLTYQRLVAFILLWPLAGLLSAKAGFGLFATLLIPKYSSLFAVGMALYLIHRHGHDLLRWCLVALNTIVAAHLTVSEQVSAIERNTGVDASPSVVRLLVFLFVGLVSVVTVTPVRTWGKAWMAVAGALTYPLYLVHEYWGIWIISNTRQNLGGKWAVVCAVAACLLLAWLLHRTVEQRFGPLLRRRIERGLSSPEQIAGGPAPDRPTYELAGKVDGSLAAVGARSSHE